MKKVVCIDATNQTPHPRNIKEGEIYSTAGLVEYKGKQSYFIIESEFHFVARRFIPLSDIDETELVNEFLTEKA